jgi:hypothetical protein
MATDKFTYDAYESYEQWHVDVKLRATGERVYQTVQYSDMHDAVEAALDWMDDNMDNEDIG